MGMVRNTLFQEHKVFLFCIQAPELARGYPRTAAVHLQRAHGAGDDPGVRRESAESALQVPELLETDVGRPKPLSVTW